MPSIKHLFWSASRTPRKLVTMAKRAAPATEDTTDENHGGGRIRGLTLEQARASFANGHGYLNACSMGLPPIGVTQATIRHAHQWADGVTSPGGYSETVERVRTQYAGLMSVPVREVAIASQTAVLAGLVAASIPAGAE